MKKRPIKKMTILKKRGISSSFLGISVDSSKNIKASREAAAKAILKPQMGSRPLICWKFSDTSCSPLIQKTIPRVR